MAEEHSPFYKYKKLFNNSMENKDESQKELCTGIIKSNEGFDKIYNEDDFYKVCPVSLYYLDDLYKNSYNFMDEGCKYLYYGIYNNILKKENYSYDKLEFYKILLEGYYNINEWDSYESYIKEINKDILENNNDLMEMYDNLDNFKENKSQNKDDQCKYVNKCIEIYTKYAKNYKTNNDLFYADLNEFIE
ncbi:hypothetical protein PVT01_000065000 [Plasmodium vivax]|uniref:VIR protein n=1 Tax=Plasmodium vivax TaxID=5855 RepID=A0A1G4E9A3_PLAVI|nr:hypothetical protein PVT01_000065000 [Plasmodium vivax]